MSVVICPVCYNTYPLDNIDSHVDECLRKQSENESELMHCKMCKNEVQLESIFYLSCDHSFCLPCLKIFVVEKINEKKCSEIICFENNCGKIISQVDIEYILQDQELLNKYIENSLTEVISVNPNLAECPGCNFKFEKSSNIQVDYNEVVRGNDGEIISNEALKDRAENRFRCPNCKLEFCAKCHTNPYHLGFTCDSYKSYKSSVHCRFCDCQLTEENRSNPPMNVKSMVDVCNDEHCLSMRNEVCEEILPCGHYCCGVKNESDDYHPPCTHDECLAKIGDEDKTCVICTYPYRYQPTISLLCGHLFHLECITIRIKNRWPTATITFDFILCPLCKQKLIHPTLDKLIEPYKKLYKEIEAKALERFRHMRLHDAKEITDESSPYYKNPLAYSLARFCYYECYKCKKPYFGGLKDCNAEFRVGSYEPKDLICGSCASQGNNTCLKHGTEYIEYKCKFCCNVACWFCWGTTHFCDDCHKIAGTIAKKKKEELPKCTCKVPHPPNGEEYCLGCSVCRFEQNY